MPKLPVKQASDLADMMAKRGLSGSISMGKAMPMDEPEEDHEESEYASDLDTCAEKLADAIVEGDKGHLKDCLLEFAACLQKQDEEQDSEDMS